MSVPLKIAAILALWVFIGNTKVESCGGLICLLAVAWIITLAIIAS